MKDNMNEKSKIVKDALLVTIGSFVVLLVAFLLYFLVFMLFETVIFPHGSYTFVSPLRIGYGIVWMLLCPIAYRSGLSNRLKACILAGSLGTFLISMGVALSKNPAFAVLVTVLLTAATVFLLYLSKKEWIHFYAVVLAVLAAIIYL